jgi:hypothetical protein
VPYKYIFLSIPLGHWDESRDPSEKKGTRSVPISDFRSGRDGTLGRFGVKLATSGATARLIAAFVLLEAGTVTSTAEVRPRWCSRRRAV